MTKQEILEILKDEEIRAEIQKIFNVTETDGLSGVIRIVGLENLNTENTELAE